MNLKRGLTVLTIVLILVASSVTYAFALGETQQGISLLDAVEQEKNTEAEEALQEILIATKPDYSYANSKFGRVSQWVGKLKGLLLSLLWIFAGLLTTLDLLYLTIAPIRQYLAPQTSGGGSTSQYIPRNRFGVGYGGHLGQDMYGQLNQTSYDNQTVTSPSLLGRQWVSDEALDTVIECSAPSNLGMGVPSSKRKNKLWTYFKKRTFVLVLVVFVPLVLTSSITYKIGFFLYNLVLGIDIQEIVNMF